MIMKPNIKIFKNLTFYSYDGFKDETDYFEFDNVQLISCSFKDSTIFEGVDDLKNITFSNCLFEHTGFISCQLNDITFVNCRFMSKIAYNSKLNNVKFYDCITSDEISYLITDNELNDCFIDGDLVVLKQDGEGLGASMSSVGAGSMADFTSGDIPVQMNYFPASNSPAGKAKAFDSFINFRRNKEKEQQNLKKLPPLKTI